MDLFIGVAVAHFLALLIPGVDFFLIARTSVASGWRNATGVCVGIATANAILIAAAFSGLSLISHPTVLLVLQLAGGVFLVVVGIAFLRAPGRIDAGQDSRAEPVTWARGLGLGLASGLLNPKNVLFYVSLATTLVAADTATLVFYGAWMVAVVLVWDVLVAVVLGSRRSLVVLGRLLPWLTKAAGLFLSIFGLVMAGSAGVSFLAG